MKIQRGQASTEYLVIVGFVLIILIPVIIIYFKYSGGTSDIIESTKTTQLANELVKAANEVFSFGEGSQKKITISFPSGLTGLTFNGKEIVFTFVDSKGNANEFVEVADVNFAPTQVSITPGQKEVIIKSIRDSDTSTAYAAVFIACPNGNTRTGSAEECTVLCSPNRPAGCTLTCSNSAWVC